MAKSFWENAKKRFVEGFQPMSARADNQVEENKQETGDQLAEDMKLSPNQRAAKFRKGFMKKLNQDAPLED